MKGLGKIMVKNQKETSQRREKTVSLKKGKKKP
jgi:hypothetical protein